jgi:hypothetical protein
MKHVDKTFLDRIGLAASAQNKKGRADRPVRDGRSQLIGPWVRPAVRFVEQRPLPLIQSGMVHTL